MLLGTLAAGAVAQSATGITFPAHHIPAGTLVNVRLLNGLTSDTANVGDPVRAEVVGGDASGLPEGTILDGQVTQVRSATSKHPGLINVQFGAGGSDDLASAHIVGSTAKSEKSQDVTIGAGLGGLLGLSRKRKLGDALGGAALGALGGYAVDQAQKRPASDVTLKKGSVIPVHLDRSLALRTEIDAY
jgi:hypothetical protein